MIKYSVYGNSSTVKVNIKVAPLQVIVRKKMEQIKQIIDMNKFTATLTVKFVQIMEVICP